MFKGDSREIKSLERRFEVWVHSRVYTWPWWCLMLLCLTRERCVEARCYLFPGLNYFLPRPCRMCCCVPSQNVLVVDGFVYKTTRNLHPVDDEATA